MATATMMTAACQASVTARTPPTAAAAGRQAVTPLTLRGPTGMSRGILSGVAMRHSSRTMLAGNGSVTKASMWQTRTSTMTSVRQRRGRTGMATAEAWSVQRRGTTTPIGTLPTGGTRRFSRRGRSIVSTIRGSRRMSDQRAIATRASAMWMLLPHCRHRTRCPTMLESACPKATSGTRGLLGTSLRRIASVCRRAGTTTMETSATARWRHTSGQFPTPSRTTTFAS
mmetsp:Transcript_55256/g.139625  ORF Transcript_55256/g.139625 Transcript_55256/m.139625 type:complete len:227 (-) Transcript_55256:75-755(-)